MTRTVHVHLHNHGTRDGFRESDHPRNNDGEFSEGGKGGKSDYAKAREAEHDARRDKAYAESKAKVKQLEARLEKAQPSERTAIRKELKALGWKEPAKVEKPRPAPKEKTPAPAKEPKQESMPQKRAAVKKEAELRLSAVTSKVQRFRRDLERAEDEEEHRT
ncbi:hypothetical protein D3C87_1396630 [compost metagenome]